MAINTAGFDEPPSSRIDIPKYSERLHRRPRRRVAMTSAKELYYRAEKDNRRGARDIVSDVIIEIRERKISLEEPLRMMLDLLRQTDALQQIPLPPDPIQYSPDSDTLKRLTAAERVFLLWYLNNQVVLFQRLFIGPDESEMDVHLIAEALMEVQEFVWQPRGRPAHWSSGNPDISGSQSSKLEAEIEKEIEDIKTYARHQNGWTLRDDLILQHDDLLREALRELRSLQISPTLRILDFLEGKTQHEEDASKPSRISENAKTVPATAQELGKVDASTTETTSEPAAVSTSGSVNNAVRSIVDVALTFEVPGLEGIEITNKVLENPVVMCRLLQHDSRQQNRRYRRSGRRDKRDIDQKGSSYLAEEKNT